MSTVQEPLIRLILTVAHVSFCVRVHSLRLTPGFKCWGGSGLHRVDFSIELYKSI